MKTLISPLLLVAALFLSGCMSSSVIRDNSKHSIADELYFRPVGLYVDDSSGDWAFIGHMKQGTNTVESQELRFLIFPKSSILNIKRGLSGPYFSYFMLECRKTKSAYAISSDLPQNFSREYRDPKEITTASGLMFDAGLLSRTELTSISPSVVLLLPGAIVLDAISAPLQVWIYHGLKSQK